MAIGVFVGGTTFVGGTAVGAVVVAAFGVQLVAKNTKTIKMTNMVCNFLISTSSNLLVFDVD